MMENQGKEFIKRLWKVVLLIVIMAGSIISCFDFYYDLNDDTAIKDIISGTYTGQPDGHSIQQLYPLAWFLSLLYRAIPGISWYGLFLCLCQFGVIALIAWRLTGLIKSEIKQIFALVLWGAMAVGMFIRELVIVQYSVTSAMCMLAAIFLFLTVKFIQSKCSEDNIKGYITPILLVVISYMLRPNICIMMLPFLLLAGLSEWSAEEKPFSFKNLRKYLMIIGSALALMLMAFVIDKVAYGSTQWKEFRDFFDARTSLYDFYEIPDYDKNEEFYKSIDMQRESYELLKNYNFALDDSIDAAKLEKIRDYQKENAGQVNNLNNTFGFVSKNNLSEALWLYKQHLLLLRDGIYAYIILAAYLLYAIIAAGRKKSGWWWKIAFLVLIRSILWLYLFMVDRVLDRVTLPLLIGEFALIAGWIVNELLIKELKKEDSMQKPYMQVFAYRKFVPGGPKFAGCRKGMDINNSTQFVMLIFAVCAVAAFTTNAKATVKEYQERERVNAGWESLIEYCKEHTDNYYVVDVYSSTSSEGIPYSEKMFVDADNEYRNFDICGGWIAKSPLMNKKLAKSGLTDIQTDLCSTDKNVYFIAKADRDVEWLKDYYNEKGQAVDIIVSDILTLYDKELFIIYKIV